MLLQKIIKEFNDAVDEALINDDGTIRLDEKQIFRNNGIVLSVYSNEIGRHNRPHVNVEYKNRNYVFAIDGSCDLLGKTACENEITRYLSKKYVEPNLQICRKAWNGIKSNYKFIEKDGKFYSKQEIN